MNDEVDYTLFELLYKLSTVLDTFPDPGMQSEIDTALQTVRQKKLTVAVVGEFKRGKSTLINALLGMPILPVDVEPTTAAINRITYGLKPRAILHYRDGRDLEIPLSSLADYVTKLTPEAAAVAGSLREAEVQYPTELCRNHIDIIDTPGLNDTESMTAVTEQQLREINVAVVAVNATMPYSETECYWMAKLLSLPKLQHIVVVLTCMDLVPRRDRERVAVFASSRIRKKTLETVRRINPENLAVLDKAGRIFSEEEFRIYPVSALLALTSFDNGDHDLLEESRIPALKKALMSMMNAQMQMKGVWDTERIIEKFAQSFFAAPVEYRTAAMERQAEALTAACTLVHTYFPGRPEMLEQGLQSMNGELAAVTASWLSDETLEKRIQQIFTMHLAAVSVRHPDQVLAAIRRAEAEVTDTVLIPLRVGLQKAVNGAILRGAAVFFRLREEALNFAENASLLEECGFPSSAMLRSKVVAPLKDGISCALPEFSIEVPRFLLNQNIIQTLVVPHVSYFCRRYRSAWQSSIPGYARQWSAIVLQAEPETLAAGTDNLIHSRVGALREQGRALDSAYQRAESVLRECEDKIRSLKKSLA